MAGRRRQHSPSSRRCTTNAADDYIEPPPGKTYLTIGQDLFSIEGYIREQYNFSLHQYAKQQQQHHHQQQQQEQQKNHQQPHEDDIIVPSLQDFLPAAVMFYTDIQTLRGLDTPVDYGSGVEYADGLFQGIDDDGSGIDGLQVGLWLNGSSGCRDIVHGKLDHQIQRLYDYLLEQCQAKRVFLRIGYEFDNPQFGYSDDPAVYRQAFQTVVDACRANYVNSSCNDKIRFVWHSWAAGLPQNSSNNNSTTTFDDFYPGDDYVDWIGISLFSQFYPDSQLGDLDTVQQVLAYGQSKKKKVPVMIAESTPFGGIDKLTDPWRQWFEPVLNLIEKQSDNNNIAMWCYIDCDWETQPMWTGVGFGDTRLSTNRTVMKLWQEHVLHNPRFLNRIVNVPCENEDLLLGKGRISSGQLLSPWYWIPVVAIALAAICFRYWFPIRDASGRTYMRLDDEEVDEDNFQVEANRTGYGSLE